MTVFGILDSVYNELDGIIDLSEYFSSETITDDNGNEFHRWIGSDMGYFNFLLESEGFDMGDYGPTQFHLIISVQGTGGL